MLPQLAIATSSLKLPLRTALKTAAILKVQGVRIDARNELKPREFTETGKRDLSNLLRELNLKLASVSFPVRRSLYEQADLDARVNAIREAMELTGKLSVAHLCLKIGIIPEDETSKDYQRLYEAVSDLAQYGNHIGVVLTVTPMGEPPDRLRNFIERIRTGPVAIDFDPAVMVLNEINPAEALRLLHQYVKQFTARDAVRDFSGGGQEVPLGRGEVVWDETLATLAEIPYHGPVVVQPQQSDHPREEIEQGLVYLKNVTGELGWG